MWSPSCHAHKAGGSGLPDEVPADQLQHADYMWKPPDVSGGQRLAMGLMSIVAVLGSTLVLEEGLRSRQPRREWLWVTVPAAGVAGYMEFTFRVGTAPVSGANIGAGLLILAGFIVVPTLVGVSLSFVLRLRFPLTP